MRGKLAAQLYTVREELTKGILPVFVQLKKMGWDAVQISALPHGYDCKEVAEALKETGLQTAGMHVSLDRLLDDPQDVRKEADLYGTRDLICPYLSEEYRHEEGYREVKSILNKLARKLPNYRISYHNHDFEFATKIQDVLALDYLLNPQSSNLLLAEIDVYWVKKAGIDPLTFMQPYAGRMPIIHLKDMTDDEEETFAEVGTGKIDFLPILRWGERSGVEWYAVEQDVCPDDPFASLQISFDNLMRLSEKL